MTSGNARADVAVVGAGIVGLAVAHEIIRRHPDRTITVVEREAAVGRHQSGHNSGVVHSGVYYAPGSLKARLCVDGARLMYDFCDRHAVPVDRCGKLIVALEDRELGRLDELERRGRANGVRGMRRLTASGIRDVEPVARGIAALHIASTGVVDYAAVCRALEADLVRSGVTVRTCTAVTAVVPETGGQVLLTDAGEIRAASVITCAGLWSDRLAVASGAPADPRIVPFRGAYLTVDPAVGRQISGLIYPVPDPELPFLGVHITRTIDGQTTLGPTALIAGARDGYRLGRIRRRDVWETVRWPGTYRVARRFWRTGLDEIRTAADSRRLVAQAACYAPVLAGAGIVDRSRSGVRAQAVSRGGELVDDFVLTGSAGVLHVRNAPSPAATSAFALAREIVDRVEADSGS